MGFTYLANFEEFIFRRLPSFTEFYWALPDSIELYRVHWI